MKKYDAIIIGFGKAGKTLAADLGNRGWNVAIVERSDKMYGGTCINIGCIPTKKLVHMAKVTQYRKPASFEQYREEYKNAIREKSELTAALRKMNFDNLDTKDTVTVYTGVASFLSPHQIEVKMAEETLQLESQKIFINTGASTVIPPIVGLEGNPFVYTSTTIMELDRLPRKLAIVGGGYIGLEFASIFAGFGSEVVILEGGDRFMAREDRDIAEAVKNVFQKKGIEIHVNARVEKVEHNDDGAVITYKDENGVPLLVPADAVLLATGRRPNTKDLNLEAAGVVLTNRGAIATDPHLHTNVPGIWAMGDVVGGMQFTFISLDDYRVIKDELFGGGKRTRDDRMAVAYTVFIDPPLSRIGMGEEEALRSGRKISIAKIAAAAFPRTRAFGQTDGLLKAIVDTETGQILGCTLFCAESTEVINTVSMAIRAGKDYRFLRDGIYTHPSMSESLNDLFALIK